MKLSNHWLLWAGLLTPLLVARAAELRISEEKDAVRVVSPYLDLRLSLRQPAILSVSVDSLGLGKGATNSLRPPAAVSPPFRAWRAPGDGLRLEYFRPDTMGMGEAGWRFEVAERTVRLVSRWTEAQAPEPVALEFDPQRCHVTLLGIMNTNGSVRLPVVIHFPDQGSFRITGRQGPSVAAVADRGGSGTNRDHRSRLQAEVLGDRAGPSKDDQDLALGYDARRAGTGYIRVTFPAATPERRRVEYRWEVAAIHPPLSGKEQDPSFNGFRRNWLNILQLNPRLRVLANHAASDTCAFCLYEYADIARATPPLAERLTALDLIRDSLDRYLEGLAGYGLPGNVMFDAPGEPSTDPPYLDSYPSLLIAATEYVAGSGDTAWLGRRYQGLRGWADKLLAMDRDGNGLFEYPYSGNSGSWSGKGEKRPSNWWDTIGFGHEDAYANALAYRALRGMEAMAARLGKTEEAGRYRTAADKLRAAYGAAFYNPATGILAGWRSADGALHDYWFLFVNGIAIHYGLLPKPQANAIMDRLLAKLKAVGYTRFDLGLPGNLVPVARKDYVHRERRWGGGEKEDNSDGFQIYENGGATACFAYFTLAALYDLGRRDEADRMLFPLLAAFEEGAFQGQGANGMSNDWKAWDGTPWGYEGFLVDNYYALLAVLARDNPAQARAAN